MLNQDEQHEQDAAETPDQQASWGDSGDGDVVIESRKPLNRTSVVLFALVVVGAAGMYFMHLRSGPQAASAAAATEAQAASKTIKEFLDGKTDNLKLMETMLRDTEKVVQQFLAYPSATQVPLGELQTNPFHFVSDRPVDAAKADDVERKRREEQRVAVLKAASALKVQSIMHSDAHKSCMVNSAMYQEGQQVEGFVIERIGPSSIIVKKDTYRFELRMQK